MNTKTLVTEAEDRLNEYLLGNNSNLIGTIIAFRKSLVKLPEFIEKYAEVQQTQQLHHQRKTYIPESYAVLLYFDHRKARIVRYLFNPNLTFWQKTPILYNKNSVKYFSNEKLLKPFSKLNPYLFNYKGLLVNEPPVILTDDNDMKHIQDKNNLHNFKNLVDGKISKMMITLFMLDLIRGYLLFDQHKVYDTSDMKMIREHTTPTKIVSDIHFSISIDTKISESSSTDLSYVDTNYILPYPKDDKIIYHQKSVYTKDFDYTFNSMNCKFEEKANKDLPPVIKDLRKFISTSTIQNKKYLDDRIARFNKALELKVNKLYEGSSKRRS